MAATTDLAILQDLLAVTGRGVADGGCGGGWLARELEAAGARVTALNISEGQLAATKVRPAHDRDRRSLMSEPSRG